MKLKRMDKNNRKTYKLRNKAKFISILIILGVVLYTLSIPLVTAGVNERKTVLVYINEGDTLWDIAAEYNPGSDIRSAVHDIKDYNGMQSYDIKAGTYITVPL